MQEPKFVVRKAERQRVKLRIGIRGPSGSGKTLGALLLAYGMVGDWDKICLIDTENESAALYVGKKVGGVTIPPFPHIALSEPYTPERYIAAQRAAEEAGAEIIIMDSATHEWDGPGGCLEIVDKLGGRFTDWKDVTPRHRRFIDAMNHSPAHTIVTMRTKQEFAQDTDSKGKKTVVKLGMREVQREGFEYELTVSFDVEINHLAKTSKDRTGIFMDRPSFIIGPEIGRELKDWNETGKEPAKDYTLVKRRIATEATRLGLTPGAPSFRAALGTLTGLDATKDENLEAVLAKLETLEPTKPEDKPPTPPAAPIAPAENAAAPEKAEDDVPFPGTAPVGTVAAAETDTRPQPKMSSAALLLKYKTMIDAAPDLGKLDEVHGLWTMDKDVIESAVVNSALAGLEEQKMMALSGIAPKAPGTAQDAPTTEKEPEVVHDENSQARPTPASQARRKTATPKKKAAKEEPKSGVCPSCEGKGATPNGTDCAACDGTGLARQR